MKPSLTDLRWLLLGLACVLALHVSELAPWVSVFVVAFGGWRYAIERHGWRLPSLWLLLPVTVIAGIGIIVTYHGLFGRDASVALLAVMLSLKLMETRTTRDYVLLVFGGYFLTVTAFLFNQSMFAAALMLAPLVTLTTAHVGVSHANGDLPWRFQLRLAVRMLLQSVPVMLVLFVLFPRVPGPLWGLPEDSYRGLTGLSDTMQPGNISQLTQSGAIAFRAEFKGKVPPTSQLYWRGPVLWHYDGTVWHMASPYLRLGAEHLAATDEPIDYAVTLEPHNRRWLLLLDMPTRLPANSSLTADMQALSKDPVRARMRYEATSSLRYALAPQLGQRAREMALQINDDDNPQSRALAAEWQQSAKSPAQIVQNALAMYRQQAFSYTLSPPLLNRVSPIDDFLFHTRRGFCEHYAGSFVYLMRAAGIPARVVTGYQGGEVNPVGNYLIVRQSDAHAWAEVWLEGRGWVRVDPTAAVAPSRIERGIAAALPDSNPLPLLARREYPLLRKLYLNWDAINNGWNQWVLGYDERRQLDLLSRLTGSQLSWQDLTLGLVIVVTAVMGVISFFLLRGRRLRLDPLQRIYRDFLRKLERAGIKHAPHEGPLDFSRRAAASLPARAEAIRQIGEAYARLRYRGQASLQELQGLRQLIKNFGKS